MITLDLIEYVDYKWEVMAPASEARNDSLKHGSSTTLPDMVKLVLLGVVGGGGWGVGEERIRKKSHAITALYEI